MFPPDSASLHLGYVATLVCTNVMWFDLDYATAQDRVLYSFNIRDFYRLHIAYLTEGKSHAGMILARQQRYSVGEQMRRLLQLIAVKSAEEMKNQVEFLSAWD